MAIRFRVARDNEANPPCWVVAAVNESDRSNGFVGVINPEATKGDVFVLGSYYGVKLEEIEFI